MVSLIIFLFVLTLVAFGACQEGPFIQERVVKQNEWIENALKYLSFDNEARELISAVKYRSQAGLAVPGKEGDLQPMHFKNHPGKDNFDVVFLILLEQDKDANEFAKKEHVENGIISFVSPQAEPPYFIAFILKDFFPMTDVWRAIEFIHEAKHIKQLSAVEAAKREKFAIEQGAEMEYGAVRLQVRLLYHLGGKEFKELVERESEKLVKIIDQRGTITLADIEQIGLHVQEMDLAFGSYRSETEKLLRQAALWRAVLFDVGRRLGNNEEMVFQNFRQLYKAMGYWDEH